MNIKPLYDKIVVKPIKTEDTTPGGIIIPDTAKEKPVKGKVVAVGDGVKNEKGDVLPLLLKVGDEVLYNKWGCTEIKIGGEELLIMKESDVLCIVQ